MAGSFSGAGPPLGTEKCVKSGGWPRLPTSLESGAEALVGDAGGGLADRAGDGDAVEQLLLGAYLAQPFVVRGRQGLAGDETGAGVGNAQLRGLIGFVAARGMA